MEKLFSDRLIRMVDEAQVVVALTGAGVSAESGVPTFRDKDGLWNKFNPSELANMDAFMKNPELVWEWYQWRQQLISSIEPNPGHYALAEMEQILTGRGKKFWLITQNVDGLHRKAGSKNVLELHGNIMRDRCMKCGHIETEVSKFYGEKVPCCPKCKGMLRPDVVWFGEMLPAKEINKALEVTAKAGVFFSIGTSAVVYPAAGLPLKAKDEYAYVVEINPERSAIAGELDEVIQGKSGEVLPLLVEQLGQ